MQEKNLAMVSLECVAATHPIPPNIGCLNNKCRGLLLNMHTMEHVEMQLKYHLIEVNLFDILVYGFFLLFQ